MSDYAKAAIAIAAVAVLLIPIVHAFYVYVMGIKRARDNDALHWPVKCVSYPTIALFLPLYVLLNLTLGTILFLELPRSLQFTKRCQRHMADHTWRGRQARWWCKNWLDPFEEGGHC